MSGDHYLEDQGPYIILELIDIIIPGKRSLTSWPGAQLIVYIINNAQLIINNVHYLLSAWPASERALTGNNNVN